jgi:hypothetical protein
MDWQLFVIFHSGSGNEKLYGWDAWKQNEEEEEVMW